jgi:hypothetical protein
MQKKKISLGLHGAGTKVLPKLEIKPRACACYANAPPLHYIISQNS